MDRSDDSRSPLDDRSDGGRSDGETLAPAASSGDDGSGGELMTSGDVAQLFGVDPKTVARWADAGKLRALRTLGGHRRYRPDEVRALLDELST